MNDPNDMTILCHSCQTVWQPSAKSDADTALIEETARTVRRTSEFWPVHYSRELDAILSWRTMSADDISRLRTEVHSVLRTVQNSEISDTFDDNLKTAYVVMLGRLESRLTSLLRVVLVWRGEY